MKTDHIKCLLSKKRLCHSCRLELLIQDRDLLETLSYASRRIIAESCISFRFKGYQYITEAMIILYFCGQSQGGLTKLIYPAIASQYNVSSASVETGIRNAIKWAWFTHRDLVGKVLEEEEQVNQNPLNAMFQFDHRPTNSEYLYGATLLLHQALQTSPVDITTLIPSFARDESGVNEIPDEE